jgi:hypothetical protein
MWLGVMMFLAGWLNGRLTAATLVGDFETETEVAAWRKQAQGWSRFELTPEYATSGKAALRFTSPAWKSGRPEWPSFQAVPGVTNWAGYDRLVVDLINPNAESHYFGLFVSDDKTPVRKGLSYRFEVPTSGFRRFEIPLATFPKGINRSNIAAIHFFTERPKTDLVLHLDQLVLLRPGETLPWPGAPFVRQVAGLTTTKLDTAAAGLTQARQTILALAGDARTRAHALRQVAQLEAPLKAWSAELAGAELDQLRQINADLEAMPRKIARAQSVLRLHNDCVAAGQPARQFLVGAATSMEKIAPREADFNLKAARDLTLSLARNEKESLQLLVLPVEGPLRRVEVKVSDLKTPAGAVLGRTNIQCEVTGYVQTSHVPPYGSPQVGWWPDPILNFLGPVEIAENDLQSFWVRVGIPTRQPPGVYQGKLTVTAQGAAAVTVKLTVRVHAFALPDHSPLPLAITFSPQDHALPESAAQQAKWRASPDYPVNAWKKHRLRWADFLADYRINYDSLYRSGPPDYAIIKHLHDQGRLTAFNLGIFDAVARGSEASRSNALAGLRTSYQQARELGVLDHAYLYGFDECKPEMFPVLEQTAQLLRREFPGVLLMTTSYDHSYGMDTVVKTMDAWCPLTPSFKPAQAAAVRAAGRQVWWYICCGPLHPHANMFVEYPAIEGRLLMGAMTARQRPDGFLYYQISIWNSRTSITNGPFTDWEPRSWTTYHGDGSWTCTGPDGTPLPTVRLENFRDGLEDYAYVCVLEEIVRQFEARSASLSAAERQWLAESKGALVVPEALVKSMTEYARDPALLYSWRNRLGDLIDRSGEADANPWGSHFGVRGFPMAPAPGK